jgi:sigma-B regulation protein RsbQ
MSIHIRNHVHLVGAGPATVIFVHGFGCDQTMWRALVPMLSKRYRVITFDLVGSGESDRHAYDRARYATLDGYAVDLNEIVDACAIGPTVVVGHSVGAMIALLATIAAPSRFAAQVMISPTPSFLNDGGYVGGFTRNEMDELLALMETDFGDWANHLAPAIMGAPNQPELGRELARSFARNDPAIARQFARATFLADHRADLARSSVPALILQCTDDLLVPREVGDYLLRHLPNATLQWIDNVGHCPHVSASSATGQAIEAYLDEMLARVPL